MVIKETENISNSRSHTSASIPSNPNEANTGDTRSRSIDLLSRGSIKVRVLANDAVISIRVICASTGTEMSVRSVEITESYNGIS